MTARPRASPTAQVSIGEMAMFIAVFVALYPLIVQIIYELVNLAFVVATTSIPLLDYYDGDYASDFWAEFKFFSGPQLAHASAILLIAAVLVRLIPNVWASIPLIAIVLIAGDVLYAFFSAYRNDINFHDNKSRYWRVLLEDLPYSIAWTSINIAGAFLLVHLYARFRSRSLREYLL